MKTTHYLFISIIGICCSGCLGNLISPDAVAGGSISCKINGKSWTANEAAAVSVLGIVSMTGTTGSGKNTSTVLLALPKDKVKSGANIDLAEENLEDFTLALTSYEATVNGVKTFYAVTTGEIKINIAKGKKISGTFSFKGVDLTGENPDVNIESGKFDVSVLF